MPDSPASSRVAAPTAGRRMTPSFRPSDRRAGGAPLCVGPMRGSQEPPHSSRHLAVDIVVDFVTSRNRRMPPARLARSSILPAGRVPSRRESRPFDHTTPCSGGAGSPPPLGREVPLPTSGSRGSRLDSAITAPRPRSFGCWRFDAVDGPEVVSELVRFLAHMRVSLVHSPSGPAPFGLILPETCQMDRVAPRLRRRLARNEQVGPLCTKARFAPWSCATGHQLQGVNITFGPRRA